MKDRIRTERLGTAAVFALSMGSVLLTGALSLLLWSEPAARAGARSLSSSPQDVKVEELRAATEQDRIRLAAERAQAEGTQLGRPDSTADSKRKAIEKLEEALRGWQTLGDRPREALTLHNLGIVAFSLGENQKALDYLTQALPQRRMGDCPGAADTLHEIGNVYYLLDEKRKALDYWNQALPLLRAVGNRPEEAALLNNVGFVYNILGEKQKALDHYRQALPLWQDLGDQGWESIILNNLGTVYFSLGEQQKALDHYYPALRLERATGDILREAHTLSNLGLVYGSLDRKQEALDYYHQALSLMQAMEDRAAQAATLTNSGAIYDSLGELQRALDYHYQALPLWQAVGDRRGEAQTRHNIGAVHETLGEKQKALDYYHQALSLWRAVGIQSGEALTRYRMAHIARDRGQISEARTQMEAVLGMTESLRSKVSSQDLRASYFALKQDYYEFYIDLLMRLHQRHPFEGHNGAALEASERARARSLLEMLTEAHADLQQGVDPVLIERQHTLQQRINAKEQYRTQLLSGKHTAEQAAAAEKELVALLTQYQEVQGQLRATSPRYAALTQPPPLSLKEIQQQVLDDETLLLEYTLGEERSYLWAVTPTSITSFELPPRAAIESVARRVYDLLNARNQRLGGETVAQQRRRVRRADQEYAEAAAALSRMVLGPVARQLGSKRLLIVSAGALQYVPFGALPAPAVPGRRQDRAKFIPLIVQHEIVSLPSASTLAVHRRELAGRRPATKAVAVLADPVFGTHDPRVKRSPRVETTETSSANSDDAHVLALERSVRESGLTDGGAFLARLPSARWEAEGILARVPTGEGMKAVDFAASRATATSPELSQYRIVHFATHGLLNSQHPDLSGIVLSLVDERGAAQDGFLRLHDIYNLNLPVELVVLSACQTALGKEVKGEGLLGLTRGFMYAGASRVVASLWKVDDAATAELMERFYRSMLGDERRRPVAALRAAQVAMAKEDRWRAPYYWAAFVLQGEWR